MDAAEVKTRILNSFAWVGDAGTRGVLADRTGWTRDPQLLGALGSALGGLFAEERPTVVFAPQSSGYLFGALVAQSIGVGFVGAAKERGDLADSDKWLVAHTPLDYLGRNMALSFRARLLGGGDRVLVVDDWADTGGQLLAMMSLVEQSGARYLGSAVVIDALTDHSVRRKLLLRSLVSGREL